VNYFEFSHLLEQGNPRTTPQIYSTITA